MAKNLLVWAIFKATGYVKIWVWCRWIFELIDLSPQWRSKNLGANPQQPSLAYLHGGGGASSQRGLWPRPWRTPLAVKKAREDSPGRRDCRGKGTDTATWAMPRSCRSSQWDGHGRHLVGLDARAWGKEVAREKPERKESNTPCDAHMPILQTHPDFITFSGYHLVGYLSYLGAISSGLKENHK